MIAALLFVVSFQIEDYLPGSPARLETAARQQLEQAQQVFAASAYWQLDLSCDGAHWRYRLSQGEGAWRNRVDADGHSAGFATWLAASELEFEDRLAGCTPMLQWIGSDPLPPSGRWIERDQKQSQGITLATVRDGWTHHLQLDQAARVLAWASSSDLAWGRPEQLTCKVIAWQAMASTDLPSHHPEMSNPSARTPARMDADGGRLHRDWFDLPANEALQLWLQEFSLRRRVRVEAIVSMQVGEGDDATQYGDLRMLADLTWPAYGQLELKGQVGIGADVRLVHTQVRGDGARYWHWNRSDDACKSLRSLADLLAGLQGVLPLYSWAAREVPQSDWQARWDATRSGRLHCSDGPHQLQFDFTPDGRLNRCTVLALDARPGAPRMVYEFTGFSASQASPTAFAFDWRADGFGAAVDRFTQESPRADPRLDKLLPVGAPAPPKPWRLAQAANQPDSSIQPANSIDESIRDLQGRWVVVCFVNTDRWTSGPVLRELQRLQGRLDRDANDLVFRAIGCQGSDDALRSVWNEVPPTIPLGFAQSRAFQRAWKLRWYPCTYLIAPNGNIVDRWLGTPDSSLEQRLTREIRGR